MRDDKGRFAEGNEGRPKGIPNKTTTEIREAFSELLQGNLEQLKVDIASLEPASRVKLLLDMAQFVVPKLRNVDLKTDEKEIVTIDFNESVGWNKTDEEN
jgi:hypothetical protein